MNDQEKLVIQDLIEENERLKQQLAQPIVVPLDEALQLQLQEANNVINQMVPEIDSLRMENQILVDELEKLKHDIEEEEANKEREKKSGKNKGVDPNVAL